MEDPVTNDFVEQNYDDRDTQPLGSEGEEQYEEEAWGEEPDNYQKYPEKVDRNHHHEHRKRRSGGDNSDESGDQRSRSRRSSRQYGERDSHRKRHHRHRKDKSKHSSKRHNDSRSSVEMEGELEDGELEDGEIEDDIERNSPQEGEDFHSSKGSGTPSKLEKHRSSSERSPRKYQREISAPSEEAEEEYPEEGSEEAEDEEIERERKSDTDKKRKKERRERKRKAKDEKKRKKRKIVYHDYDQMEEDYEQEWGAPVTGNNKGSREKGHRNYDDGEAKPYDSPYDAQYDKNPYDNPYDSPPGPYDSPSNSEDEMYDEGNQQRTMMSFVEDEYLDANVAVDGGENIYKRQGSKKMKVNKHMMKRKLDRQHNEQQPKKKPLLMTPMNERPACKYFKEGKCSKGDDCPFNHDYLPPKKPDLCKFYLNEACTKGNNCIFMHEEFPCKFYHTGAKCYSGDNCKFSHAPLTDETRAIVDKFFHDSRGGGGGGEEEPPTHRDRVDGPRPSLLGAPPAHLVEAAARIKKIPSIFDIQVFPPGHSPKKQDGPHGPHKGPPRHPGPPGPHGPPPRPSGFYTDMNPPPMNRPPMSQPLMNQPPMNQPPMNQPPMNQQPMNLPPPQMGPPPTSAAMNPAVALVGALLRQAAPQVLRQNMGPTGPLHGPFPGPNGPQQHGPPPFNNSVGQFGPPSGHPIEQITSPPHIKEAFEEVSEKPPEEETVEKEKVEEKIDDPEPPVQETDNLSQSAEDESNEKKLATLGLSMDTLNHLPAKQRELFLRIQNQQAANEGEEDRAKDEKSEENAEEDVPKTQEKVDDDDWYSSDDEEGGQPKTKLTDILKNLNQKPSQPESPQTPTPGTTSALSIMQMIKSIRTQPNANQSTLSPPVDNRDPRKSLLDIKKSIEQSSPQVEIPNYPPPVIVNSSEGDVPYKLRSLILDNCKPTLPVNIDISEPQFKNDPRIKKYPPAPRIVPQPVQRPLDPRVSGVKMEEGLQNLNSRPSLSAGQTAERPFDPRIKRQSDQRSENVGELGGRIDPRLQKSVSDVSFINRPSDPRMNDPRTHSGDPRVARTQSNPHMGVHNMPSRIGDPRLLRQEPPPPKPADPRLLRQQSQEMGSPGSQPKTDPRLSRQLSGFSSGMDSGNDLRLGQGNEMPPLILDSLHGSVGDPRQIQRQVSHGKTPLLPDPRGRAGLLPLPENLLAKEPEINLGKGPLEENFSDNMKLNVNPMENEGSKQSPVTDSPKPKLDYRNDPRFKRKPASESLLSQKRFTGQRKGSMEYSSPLGMESDSADGVSGYNSYNRPNPNMDKGANTKLDPRNKSSLIPKVSDSGSLSPNVNRVSSPNPVSSDSDLTPQLAPFVPPPETVLEPKMKEFFKTMDPTASPFC